MKSRRVQSLWKDNERKKQKDTQLDQDESNKGPRFKMHFYFSINRGEETYNEIK